METGKEWEPFQVVPTLVAARTEMIASSNVYCSYSRTDESDMDTKSYTAAEW